MFLGDLQRCNGQSRVLLGLASGTTQLKCNRGDSSFHLGTSPLSSQMELLDNVHFSALRPKLPNSLHLMFVARLAPSVETMGTNWGNAKLQSNFNRRICKETKTQL